MLEPEKPGADEQVTALMFEQTNDLQTSCIEHRRLEGLHRSETQPIAAGVVEAEASYTQARIVLLSVLALVLVSGIATAVSITRDLRTLGGEPTDAMAVAAEITAGRLRVDVDVEVGDPSSLFLPCARCATASWPEEASRGRRHSGPLEPGDATGLDGVLIKALSRGLRHAPAWDDEGR